MLIPERLEVAGGNVGNSNEEVLCPRVLYEGNDTEVVFDITKDPAVQEIALMVVAGIDRKYNLHPRYGLLVRELGEAEARGYIEDIVSIPGALDIIQTEMSLGGLGLFGGLSEDESHFVFYEWLDGNEGQLMTTITSQEARDIVSGKQTILKFNKAKQ